MRGLKTRYTQRERSNGVGAIAGRDGTAADYRTYSGLIAAVAIVGIAIGAAAGLLTLMLYQVERFALGYIENAHESGPFNVPAIRRAISVTVGASIAAVIWWLLRTRTTTVPSVKKPSVVR